LPLATHMDYIGAILVPSHNMGVKLWSTSKYSMEYVQ